jgi:hypothetical protein
MTKEGFRGFLFTNNLKSTQKIKDLPEKIECFENKSFIFLFQQQQQ